MRSQFIYYLVEIRDPETKKIYLRKRGESFVENFIKILYAVLYAGSRSKITQFVGLDGALYSIPDLFDAFSYYAGTKDDPSYSPDSWGILVGTGATPVSPTDYRIESKIAHGTGLGQLSYGIMQYSYNGIITVNNVNYFELELFRTFTNQSGQDINVSETAIYVVHKNSGGGLYIFMIARDVFTPVVFPANQSRTVSYKIRVKTP